MKKRILAVILLLGMLTTLLAACGGKGVSPDKRMETNEIVIGIPQDFDSLDPHHMTAAGTKEVMFNVYEGLVKPTSDGKIVPAVASDVSVSDDGLTYTLKLRQGVKFHNGDTVEMQDVLYSLDRRMSGEDAAAKLAALDIITGVKGEGDTLTLTLGEPSGEFLAYLMNVYIVPADVSALDTNPVGTGPYKVASRAAQDNLVLERFDDYWGEKGKLSKVTFKILENAESLVLGLQSGALDLVSHMTSDQTSQLAESDFDVAQGSMNLVQALYLNNAEAPFDDVRVRQALCYAVDKQAVIDLAMDGHGTPVGTSMLSTLSRYAMPELADYYKPDAEKAKALLKEAGYENLSFTITVPSNYASHVGTAQVLVEQLKAAGVDAKIDLVDWTTWLTETYQGRNFEATVSGFDSHSLSATGCLARFQSESGKNFINFRSADYDAAYAAAVASLNAEEQTALFKQCETILAQTAANVYLQDMSTFAVMQSDVGGFVYYPALYIMDLATLYRIG